MNWPVIYCDINRSFVLVRLINIDARKPSALIFRVKYTKSIALIHSNMMKLSITGQTHITSFSVDHSRNDIEHRHIRSIPMSTCLRVSSRSICFIQSIKNCRNTWGDFFLSFSLSLSRKCSLSWKYTRYDWKGNTQNVLHIHITALTMGSQMNNSPVTDLSRMVELIEPLPESCRKAKPATRHQVKCWSQTTTIKHVWNRKIYTFANTICLNGRGLGKSEGGGGGLDMDGEECKLTELKLHLFFESATKFKMTWVRFL